MGSFLSAWLSVSAHSLYERGYLAQFARPNGFPKPPSLDGLRLVRNVSYGDGHPLQSLDVIAPAGADAAPVLVFVHGGGWRAADKTDATNVHANLGASLARRGVIVANVNYRLVPEVGWTQQIEDVAMALAFVKAGARRFGGDPKRVFLGGHSAGGHLASLVMMAGASASGFVGVSGIYDVPALRRSLDPVLRSIMFRPVFGNDEVTWEAASPASRIRAGAPRCLLVVGSADQFPGQTDAFEEALRAAHVPVESVVVPGADHYTILASATHPDCALVDAVTAFIADGVAPPSGRLADDVAECHLVR